jgi:hypothetical protein
MGSVYLEVVSPGLDTRSKEGSQCQCFTGAWPAEALINELFPHILFLSFLPSAEDSIPIYLQIRR